MIVFYTLHCLQFICVTFAEWDLIFHVLEVIHLSVAWSDIWAQAAKSYIGHFVEAFALQTTLSFVQYSHSCMSLAPASGRAFSLIYLYFFHCCFFGFFALLFPHSLICPPCFSCLFLSCLNAFELFLSTGVGKLHSVSPASFINIPFIQS